MTFHATHRHKKGGLYRVVIDPALFVTNDAADDCVVYQNSVGQYFVRTSSDFNEPGRFVPIGDAA